MRSRFKRSQIKCKDKTDMGVLSLGSQGSALWSQITLGFVIQTESDVPLLILHLPLLPRVTRLLSSSLHLVHGRCIRRQERGDPNDFTEDRNLGLETRQLITLGTRTHIPSGHMVSTLRGQTTLDHNVPSD